MIFLILVLLALCCIQCSSINIAIVGGGPSGLSQAISIMNDPIISEFKEQIEITVYEGRRNEYHGRENYVLVSKPIVDALKRMGVYDRMVELDMLAPYSRISNVNGKTTVENVQDNEGNRAIVSLMTPEDISVNEITRYQSENVDLQGIAMADLELVLRERAYELGVRIISKMKVVHLENDGKGKYSLKVMCLIGKVEHRRQADLVIVAEGSGRHLVKSSLGIRIRRWSPIEYHVPIWLRGSVGSMICRGINIPDTHYLTQTKWKRLLYGDPTAQNRQALLIMQIPASLAGNRMSGVGPELFPSGTNAFTTHWKYIDFHMNPELKDYLNSEAHAFLKNSCNIKNMKNIRLFNRVFEVSESSLEQYTAGSNVVVVGDAARSGHYFGGVGLALSIIVDTELVKELLVSTLIDNVKSMEEAIDEFNSEMESNSKAYHNYNNKNWYNQ